MTEAELLFTALAELSTRQIAESDQAEGLTENAVAGRSVKEPEQKLPKLGCRVALSLATD